MRDSTAGSPGPIPTTFEAIAEASGRIPGWLTRTQARTLYDAVRALPACATAVEIGSHQGRSTVVLAAARPDVRVVAIDPFVGGKYGGRSVAEVFTGNLRTLGLADRVRLVAEPSETVRAGWRDPVDLLYVDGAHDPWHAFQDLGWAWGMSPGATVLVHDAFSSMGVTLALAWAVVRGLPLRYRFRVGSLAAFEVNRRGRGGSCLRMLAELPWFVRNVLVKVALRLHLRPVARFLGHRDFTDPF